MSNNWDGLREMFFESYSGLHRKWKTHFYDLVEQGMDEADARDAADDLVGVGPDDSRVKKWMLKNGVVPDDEGSPPRTPEESKGTTDVKNVRWVAENLSNLKVTPASSPSPTAWNMLVFARTNPSQTAKFWSDL